VSAADGRNRKIKILTAQVTALRYISKGCWIVKKAKFQSVGGIRSESTTKKKRVRRLPLYENKGYTNYVSITMKIILVFIISLLLAFSAHAQQPFICTLPDFPSGQPSPPTSPPGACSIDFSTYDVSAPFTIYVNLFFKNGPNGLNFTPDSAVLIGHQFIDIANSQLAGMGLSNKSGPNGVIPAIVPNAKWRYKIYTEGLPGDDLGGIWLGNNPNSGMYAGKVVNININNNFNSNGTPACWSGNVPVPPSALPCMTSCPVNIDGIYSCHAEFWGLGVYARTLNHEFGHAMGLDHVSFCGNQCRFDDVDPEAHCGPNCPSLATCDLANPARIICPMGMPPDTTRCKWDFSNNLMSQGVNLAPFTNTRLPDALTPCQWEVVQNYILNTPMARVSWADNCQEIDTDYSIPSGTTVTWTSLVNINRNIIVEKNAILNINCEVRFANGTGIIVKPGGRLNINGAKLTNLCKDQPWKGIVAEGESGQSQFTPGKHGRVFVNSGSTVENALTAIKLIAGGIVYAKESMLANNGTGIEYKPYSNFWPFSNPVQPRSHLGSISNCTFLWNNDFTASDINAGVEMLEVRGIIITGCSFTNDRSIKNPMGADDYGYGVKATDARFLVTSLGIGNTFPPTSYDHTGFKGLGYGVYVGTAQSGIDSTISTSDDFVNVPYTVQQATFSECIYGIHNRFVSQGTIVGNTFNMGKLPPANSYSGNTPYTNAQYGVFIENGANGFELQENQFIKVENNVDYTYGSYCQNLGDFNNKIRRNTYTNVEAGNLADENNAVPAIGIIPPRGLYYLCNTNTNQNHDFYVYPSSDIRRNQGLEITGTSNFIAAGNVLTLANSPKGDFENNGPQARYFHDGNAEKPLYHLGLAFSDVDPNTCQSNYCLPPCREKDEWQAIKADYDAKRGSYLSAVSEIPVQQPGNATLVEQKTNLAAGYRSRMDELSNTLSLHMVFDSTTYNVDSIRVWWQKMESPVSDMVVARDLLAKGQNSKAFAQLDAISSKYNLSESELSDLNDYRAIMQIMQGESVSGLSSSKVQQLLGYANNGKGISAAWAKNILTVKGYHFPPLPKPLGSKERSPNERVSVQKTDLYIVSPNPAKDMVKFSRMDVQSLTGTFIVVTNTDGRIVWQSPASMDSSNHIIWQTTNAPAGVYFYTIRDAKGLIQSGRISIIK
jgi:hypothetical protein